MKNGEYLQIKKWLDHIEKELYKEAVDEGVSPLEIEKNMKDILVKVLESKDINADEYFRIDKQLDKEGGKIKEWKDKEINLDELEEEDEDNKIMKNARSLIKNLLAPFRKKK